MAGITNDNGAFWRGGPAPGSFYNFPGGPQSAQHQDAKAHTLSPMVTGTSVLGVEFEGGVMLAADMLGSYGSLAKFRSCQRLVRVNGTTVMGASGDFADFQFIQSLVEQRVIEEGCLDDGFCYSPKSLHSCLTSVMYNRRSRLDPLWNTLIVGGLENGVPYLGYVDKIGIAFKAPAVATGFGAHIALPLMRDALEKAQRPLTNDEARKLLEHCLTILLYRDARAFHKFQIATVNAEGAKVEGPFTSETIWSIANMTRTGTMADFEKIRKVSDVPENQEQQEKAKNYKDFDELEKKDIQKFISFVREQGAADSHEHSSEVRMEIDLTSRFREISRSLIHRIGLHEARSVATIMCSHGSLNDMERDEIMSCDTMVDAVYKLGDLTIARGNESIMSLANALIEIGKANIAELICPTTASLCKDLRIYANFISERLTSQETDRIIVLLRSSDEKYLADMDYEELQKTKEPKRKAMILIDKIAKKNEFYFLRLFAMALSHIGQKDLSILVLDHLRPGYGIYRYDIIKGQYLLQFK